MPINLKVIDISHHNTVGGSGPALAGFQLAHAFGIRGVIHKASQGTGYVDPMYAKRRQAAIDAGLLWGAYHFADASDPVAQVEHFLDAAAAEPDTLVALDYEPNAKSEMTLDGARTFLREVEQQLGRKAVLYSGNLIKETLGNQPDEFLGGHRLWLAHYSNNPKWPPVWGSVWLHQFSGDGVNSNGITVPGLSSKIDMNSYAASDSDLATEWAS